MKELDERHIHAGHRKRMLEKLARHDGDIFESYELLEMLLFFGIPYKNTNPIAKRLLHKFGSLRGVFEAGADELCEISGIGEMCAAFITKVGKLFELERDDAAVVAGREYATEDRVVKKLHALFSADADATLAILAFDNSNRIIASEVLHSTDFNSGALSASYYTDLAIRWSASMIITASNRRFGAPIPLPADRESAAMISRALSSVDVLYGEHFIFSGSSYAKVLPTLLKSHLNINSYFNKIDGSTDGETIDNANDCCHTSEVFGAFDDALAVFTPEHFEKASSLFGRFSTLSEVLMTDYKTLSCTVGERVASFIRILASIAKRRITDLVSLDEISTEAELGDYLSALCIPLNRETLFLISYDADGRLIAIDKAGEGTLNSSGVTPRALVELAMSRSARRVSIAHNHPYGKGEMSGADIAFTKSLYETFMALSIELMVHYCVSAEGVVALPASIEDL